MTPTRINSALWKFLQPWRDKASKFDVQYQQNVQNLKPKNKKTILLIK